jgi:hypothetical protein
MGVTVHYRAKGERRRPIQRESREQMNVVAYVRAKWPEVPIVCATRGKNLSGATKFHRMIQGARIKREGYEAGTPDLFICAARQGWNGLFIEMKDRDATKSDVGVSQLGFIARAEKQGYFCTVCFGADEAVKILDTYFSDKEGKRKS